MDLGQNETHNEGQSTASPSPPTSPPPPPPALDDLFSEDPQKCGPAVGKIKFWLIGSNRAKKLVVEQGGVARLLHLLGEGEASDDLRVDAAYALGSVAKGAEQQLKAVIDSGAVTILLRRECHEPIWTIRNAICRPGR